ncbi:MAG: hypothetical protein AB7K09_10355 [Planctomycetota bacterium]
MTATTLVEEYRPGTVVLTKRVFTSEEEVQGQSATATREDVYRTLVEQVDPRGRPLSGMRVYDRAWFVLDVPTGRQEKNSAVAGQRVWFRPGATPTLDDAQPLPADIASGLSLRPFDDVFLPGYPVWEGLTWEPPAESLERLNRFLRSIGLAPDQQRIRVTWSATRSVEVVGSADRHRSAVLDIEWTASGLMATPTGRTATRVQMRGSLLLDLDDKLITAVNLSGARPDANATFRIVLTRELIARTGEIVLEPPVKDEGGGDGGK